MGNATKTKLIVINDEIVCIYSRSSKQNATEQLIFRPLQQYIRRSLYILETFSL